MPSDDDPDQTRSPDLDALIGDLRAEASRRRAEPLFPIDEETSLGLELDRRAPHLLPDKLDRLALAAQHAATNMQDQPVHRTSRARAARTGERLVQLGEILAGALRALSSGARQVEGRLSRLEGDDPMHRWSVPAESQVSLRMWWDAVATRLSGRPGRVLYVGADAVDAVAFLREASVDGYGLIPAGDPYENRPDVRSGEAVDHLRAVPSDALEAVVVAGVIGPPTRAWLRDLTEQLHRVTSTVIVLSEAPWSWRDRVGTVEGDLATAKPLSAETWLELLRTPDFKASTEYGPEGVTYMMTAVT